LAPGNLQDGKGNEVETRPKFLHRVSHDKTPKPNQSSRPRSVLPKSKNSKEYGGKLTTEVPAQSYPKPKNPKDGLLIACHKQAPISPYILY
jgi:hypothetical protein